MDTLEMQTTSNRWNNVGTLVTVQFAEELLMGELACFMHHYRNGFHS